MYIRARDGDERIGLLLDGNRIIVFFFFFRSKVLFSIGISNDGEREEREEGRVVLFGDE